MGVVLWHRPDYRGVSWKRKELLLDCWVRTSHLESAGFSGHFVQEAVGSTSCSVVVVVVVVLVAAAAAASAHYLVDSASTDWD